MPYSYHIPVLRICRNCGVEFVPFPQSAGFYCSQQCAGEYRRRPAIDRFMEKVIPEPNSGCWLWIGCVLKSGYGCFGAESAKPVMRAHRFSYEHFKGPIAPDLHVRHRCDNKACVNPDHLELGTQLQNLHDAIKRGQFPRGSRAGSAILTEQIVADARATGMTPTALANATGVNVSTAYYALSRRTWTHVA